MDQENFDYLTEKLKYSGFEDKLNGALEKLIKAETPAFTLPLRMDFDSKQVDFNLHFKRSEVSERYFFNKMEVFVPNVNPEIAGKTHSFYQNQGITAKEAFNLLEGRAVQKTLLNADKEQYKAWLQLDLGNKEENGNFKLNQYHENYGYDLGAKLREFPIAELKDQTKMDWMMKSLQKGNQYPVSMEVGGKEEIMFIEANPKFKSINVYDASLSSVKSEDLKLDSAKVKVDGGDLTGEDSSKKKVKQEMKQEMKQEGQSAKKKVVNSESGEKKKESVMKAAPETSLPQTPKMPKQGKGKRV